MSEPTVDVQPTPNPNALKFTLDRPSTDGAPQTFASAEAAAGHAVAEALFAIEGVVNVFMTANFISINKAPGAAWEAIVPAATDAITKGYSS